MERCLRVLLGLLIGLPALPALRAEDPEASAPGAGLEAALEAGDLDAVSRAIEGLRGTAFLDALLHREALGEIPVPEALQGERAAAERELRQAQEAYARARDGSGLQALRDAGRQVRAAFDRVADVAARIQRHVREAIRAAPSPGESLPAIQGALRPGEVFVAYGPTPSRVVALVVDREHARVADLGAREPCDRVADALAEVVGFGDGVGDPAEAVAAARRVLVQPLALDGEARAVILSLDGRLHAAPIEMLFDAPCWRIASGSVLVALRARAPRTRGEGVLAFGDPSYGPEPDPQAGARLRGEPPAAPPVRSGGLRLVPLPATREESRAVGDVVFVGAEATETRLRAALGERPRWRAVHLACHGLLDPERPMLSALALGADAENDGLLTVLEILQLDVRADLVALSADEMGRGTVVAGEGVVGPVGAFLFSGARAVLAPLAKVDDGATVALMRAFYRRWHPDDEGGQPLPAAAALRAAQTEIGAEPQWAHPRYWAGWTIHGDPD